MNPDSVTDEVIMGLIFLVAGGVNFAFRSTFTRWAVAYYGRVARVFPWLYPGPMRNMTSEPFLRWLNILSAGILTLIGLGFIIVAILNP